MAVVLLATFTVIEVRIAGAPLFTPLATAAPLAARSARPGSPPGYSTPPRQIGGPAGLAALATVAVARTHSALASGHSATSALAVGYNRAFAIAATLSLAGLTCSLLMSTVPRAQRRVQRDETHDRPLTARQSAQVIAVARLTLEQAKKVKGTLIALAAWSWAVRQSERP